MDKIVKLISVKLALKSRLEEEKTLGIIKNIPKGFKIPPVKYIKAPSCKISINKKINADLSDSCVFL